MLEAGRFQEVEAAARDLVSRYPQFGLAWKALGVALGLQGKEALQALHEATTLLPDDAEAHHNLCIALRRSGRLDEAAISLRRALEIDPLFAQRHNNLSDVLRRLGRHAEAAQSAREALAIEPDFADAHNNLGNALRALGQLDDAMISYRRALAVRPDFVEARSNLGGTQLELGQVDEAVKSCRQALELAPGFSDAHNNLGNALMELGLFGQAVASFRQAAQICPDQANAHVNLGIALHRLGRLDEAAASCERALEIDSRSAPAMTLLAILRSDRGRFPEADRLFTRAASIDPDLSDAWAGIPQVRVMTPDDLAWLGSAQRLVERGLAPRKEIPLRHAMGKYFNDLGDFEHAFINYQRANELTKLTAPYQYDTEEHTLLAEVIMRTYTHDWIRRTKAYSDTSPRPVFIVGMPRSGTSVVEQMLASHPDVFGAGELVYWHDALLQHQATSPDDELRATLALHLGSQYLQQQEAIATGALRVTDKAPANFWSLGLIHAALPGARIIHMQRNPVDTCLSIYFQNLGVGHRYAHDLEDLAHYYRVYSRLMEHWCSALPSEAILHVSYEDLVGDLDVWSRRMVEFIGLSWDPRCLDFHQTERAVLTASKWQVRQRINNSSVGRWHNYERFVGPLLQLSRSQARACKGMPPQSISSSRGWTNFS